MAIATGASLVPVTFVHPEGPQSAAWVPVNLPYFATLIGILLVLVGIFQVLLAPGCVPRGPAPKILSAPA